ncbi:MAG: NifB/NifX family molybdenum-iron cluster-binding protein [Terracidiphilus sp.]
MKLAITSQQEGLKADVDPQFGRARYFVVVDLETNAVTTVSNAVNFNATQGAGIQAAKTILDLGVTVLITGHVGPKALAALEAGGVVVYPVTGGSVVEALEAFGSGALKPMTAGAAGERG